MSAGAGAEAAEAAEAAASPSAAKRVRTGTGSGSDEEEAAEPESSAEEEEGAAGAAEPEYDDEAIGAWWTAALVHTDDSFDFKELAEPARGGTAEVLNLHLGDWADEDIARILADPVLRGPVPGAVRSVHLEYGVHCPEVLALAQRNGPVQDISFCVDQGCEHGDHSPAADASMVTVLLALPSATSVQINTCDQPMVAPVFAAIANHPSIVDLSLFFTGSNVPLGVLEAASRISGLTTLCVYDPAYYSDDPEALLLTLALIQGSRGTLTSISLEELTPNEDTTDEVAEAMALIIQEIATCDKLVELAFTGSVDRLHSANTYNTPPADTDRTLSVAAMRVAATRPHLRHLILDSARTPDMETLCALLQEPAAFPALQCLRVNAFAKAPELVGLLQPALRSRRTSFTVQQDTTVIARGEVLRLWEVGVLQLLFLMCRYPTVRAHPKLLPDGTADPEAGLARLLLSLAGGRQQRRVAVHQAGGVPVRGERSLPPLLRRIVSYL